MGDILAAARKGDVKQLEQCLNLGANIDEEDKKGYTPLFTAASRGHKAAVDFLIARKANVNHTTSDHDNFPLLRAAFMGHREVCESLLKAGADKNMKQNGKTAAQWAAGIRRGKDVAGFIESWGQVA